MGFAKLSNSPEKYGRGRFTVSEGIAPAEAFLPDEELPTLMQGDKGAGDEFREVVLLQGTIVSVYQKADGRYVATYCRGLSGCVGKVQVLTTATGAVKLEDPDYTAGAGEIICGHVYVRDFEATSKAHSTGVAGSLGQAAKPIGVLFKDAIRPYGNSDGTRAQGDNEPVSFFCQGYVEWPLVSVKSDANATLYDNTNLVVGDYIKPDALGRPVKFIEGIDPEFLRVAQVIAREDLGTTGAAGKADYDYGMLNYMQLPIDAFDRALLKAAYTTSGIFGVKPNLSADDAAAVQAYQGGSTLGALGCVGAIRANLINL